MYKSIFIDAYGRFGYLLPLLIIAMIVASLFEGISLAMLLPLLTHFGVGSGDDGTLAQAIGGFFTFFSIPPTLGATLFVIILVLLLQVLFTVVVRILETYITTKYTAEWRNELFRKVIGANWDYLQNSAVESQTNQIMAESSRNSAALSLSLQIYKGIFAIVVYALIALFTSWQMVGGFLILGVTIWLFTRPISNYSRSIGQDVTRVSEVLYGRTQELFLNAKLIKSTATENSSINIIDRDIDAYRETYLKAGVIPAYIQALYMGLGYTFFGFSVWIMIEFANISPASVMLNSYVCLRLYTQLSNIQQLHQSFLLSAPALKNCQNELRAASNMQETYKDAAVELAEGKAAAVKFDEVTIQFADHKVLQSVSAEIPSGTTVGITGASGAGKSTMVDAIVGLKLPSQGMVYIDGYAVTSLKQREWRQQIGYVAQETLIIKGTVAENIAWGKPDASRDEIIAAAKLANAHDFITAMPEGYNTVIGGRSIRMSGGQRQRVGIARALLGTKRLVIFDEATSALDSESEQKVMEVVSKLHGRVTVIIIAHRLSSLSISDQTLVFEKGRLVERGSFEDLSEAGGPFGRLLELQTASNKGGE